MKEWTRKEIERAMPEATNVKVYEPNGGILAVIGTHLNKPMKHT